MENRLGVLAFGDSITNGGGELQWGVALQSWALWTARGLGLPYTGCAVDGATAAHVVREQIPALRRTDRGAGRALRPRLPLRRRQRRARTRAGTPAGTSATCGRRSRSSASAATGCSSPRSRSTWAGRARGRPPPRRTGGSSARRPARARWCSTCGAFGGRNLVMVDAVHPTAFGQIAIAERALDVLAADGLPVRVRP